MPFLRPDTRAVLEIERESLLDSMQERDEYTADELDALASVSAVLINPTVEELHAQPKARGVLWDACLTASDLQDLHPKWQRIIQSVGLDLMRANVT